MAIRRRRHQTMKHNGYHPHLWEYPVQKFRQLLDGIASFIVYCFRQYVWSSIFTVFGWIIRAIINIFR